MHTVTGLYKRGKYVIVEVTDLPRIKICYEVVLENGIRKGLELQYDEYEKLIYSDNLFRAKNTAFRLLARRLHTEKELRDKLRVREYSTGIIDEAIKEMQSKNYIDDRLFAEKFFLERSERKKESPLKIKMNLKKKGISSAIIEEVFNEHYSKDLILDNLRNHITKKMNELNRKKISSEIKKRKIVQSLQYKGFSSDMIFSVLNEFEL